MAGIHIVSRLLKMFSALNKEYITYYEEIMIKLIENKNTFSKYNE